MKVLITGASSGIGRALSLEYAKTGADLVIVGRNVQELQKTSEQCHVCGARSVTVANADVTNVVEMRNVAKKVADINSKIDILIANAGIRVVERGHLDIQAVNENIETNYFGVVNTIGGFVEGEVTLFKAIGIISSIGALRATHNSGAYSASKAAVNKWAGALRLKLKNEKIPVSIINLGFVSTEMTNGLNFKMPGLLNAKEAAVLIKKSFDKKCRTKTLPWQSMLIWNTLSVLPDFIYDQLIDYAKKRQLK